MGRPRNSACQLFIDLVYNLGVEVREMLTFFLLLVVVTVVVIPVAIHYMHKGGHDEHKVAH